MTDAAAFKPPKDWRGECALTPVSYTFSEFPGLIAWFKFNDGTGGTGTDLNEMTGTITKEEVIVNGAGDPWATALAITTSNTASNEVYCRHESGQTIDSSVQAINDKSVIIQIDINITGGDNDAALIEIGNASNASQRGVAVALNSGTGQPTLKAYGETADSTKYSISDFEDMTAMGRAVLTFVWNRNASSKGVWSLYKNGVLNGSGGQYAFTNDPGTVSVTVSNLAFGSKGSLGNVCLDSTIYDIKWFYTTTIPSNIDTIVYDMAQDTNELPDSAKDITA